MKNGMQIDFIYRIQCWFCWYDIPCLLLRNMGRGREYLFSSLFYNTDGLNGMRCYNGNILGLKRYGRTGASTYGPIDNLTLTLNGNWSKAVNDAVTTAAYNNSFEFKDGAKLATEYMYDANGSLIKDLNKGIEIQYNLLNLPVRSVSQMEVPSLILMVRME